MAAILGEIYFECPKPKYRIQWDYDDINGRGIVGYWVWTCNLAAIRLKPSFYVAL